MKNEEGKLIHFKINEREITITHGYNISNAFPLHFHSTYNLGVVESGYREFFYRGISTVLKPNDIFIIQPFEIHSCKSTDNSRHSYKVISLKLDSSSYFPELVINSSLLLNKIREFHTLAEYEKESPRVSSLYNEILSQIKTFSIDNNVNINKEVSLKIRLAKQFIEENAKNNISLKDMSEVACLSEYHFNRYFHRCFGLSPYAYYLICKLKISQEELIKHSSIADATYNIGFFDQSHFTKLFKKHIGVTPGKYLSDNRNNLR